MLGRLNPGVSLTQARAALQVTTSALAKEYPATNADAELIVIPETHARPNPNIGPFFRVAGMAFAALAVRTATAVRFRSSCDRRAACRCPT